jgi:hypothetical protein
MQNRFIPFLAFMFFLLLAGCRREAIRPPDCLQLQTDIISDEKEEVKIIINDFIQSLSSQKYTEENMNKLVAAIGQQCGITATLLCFDCIKTLPSQTEIRISCTGINGPIEKIIDITYSDDNKMIFNNIHN